MVHVPGKSLLAAVAVVLAILTVATAKATPLSYEGTTKSSGTDVLAKVTADAELSVLGVINNAQYLFQLSLLTASVNDLDVPSAIVRFGRDRTGLITGIQYLSPENEAANNILAAIVELLGTQDHTGNVVEQAVSGLRHVVYGAAQQQSLVGSFSSQAYVSFAPGSNLDASGSAVLQFIGYKRVDHSADLAQVVRIVSETTFTMPEKPMVMSAKVTFGQPEDGLRYRYDNTEATDAPALVPLVRAMDSAYAPASTEANDDLVRGTIETLRWGANVAAGDNQAFYKALSQIVTEIRRSSPNAMVQVVAAIGAADLKVNQHVASALVAIPHVSASLLVQKLLEQAISTSDEKTAATLLSALHFSKMPTLSLVDTVSDLAAPIQSSGLSALISNLAALTLGSLAKRVPLDRKERVLKPYRDTLFSADATEAQTVQAIYVLANAGDIETIVSVLIASSKLSPVCRLAAVRSLRDSWDVAGVADAIKYSVETMRSVKAWSDLSDRMRAELAINLDRLSYGRAPAASKTPALVAIRSALLNEDEDNYITSQSSVWNDTSDPLFDLVDVPSNRQLDVDLYPEYNAFLMANMFGRDNCNFRLAGGAFAGSGADGCLAGNFKVFDKIYMDSHFLNSNSVLADLFVYSYTLDNTFNSRLYVYVAGHVILDMSLNIDCQENVLDLFDADLVLIDDEASYPIDGGVAYFSARIVYSLYLSTSYRLCFLRTLEPYVGLELKADFDMDLAFEASLELIKLRRTGLTLDSFFQYTVGPATSLGSHNSTGTVVCEACIGVYESTEDSFFHVDSFKQTRDGRDWAPVEVRELFHYDMNGTPTHPVVEVCTP